MRYVDYIEGLDFELVDNYDYEDVQEALKDSGLNRFIGSDCRTDKYFPYIEFHSSFRQYQELEFGEKLSRFLYLVRPMSVMPLKGVIRLNSKKGERVAFLSKMAKLLKRKTSNIRVMR